MKRETWLVTLSVSVPVGRSDAFEIAEDVRTAMASLQPTHQIKEIRATKTGK